MPVKGPLIALLIFVLQAFCAVFFVSDILSSFIGISTTPLPWELREIMEIWAAFGLMIGVVLGGIMLRRAFKERHQAEQRLRRASGAFMQLLAERFEEWGLTPAEKDVALFAI